MFYGNKKIIQGFLMTNVLSTCSDAEIKANKQKD